MHRQDEAVNVLHGEGFGERTDKGEGVMDGVHCSIGVEFLKD